MAVAPALAALMTLGCPLRLAADPLGFYIGAGAGHSQVRSDLDFSALAPGFPGSFSVDGRVTGWKLMAGIRPVSALGAELAYMDFGSAGSAASVAATPTQAGLSVTAKSHPKAAALLAVGYLPIPLPHLDLFAKAGVAQLWSDVSATGVASCPLNLPCFPIFIPPYSSSSGSAHPVYGVGAQVKLATLAVRAEYERISAGSGDVDLLSLGVTFAF